MKLIFVRHGKDDERFRGGWSEQDLTAEGIKQAKQLAVHIRENAGEYGIVHILASDLPRTVTTAECVAEALGMEIRTEQRIREINNGELAGMPNETARERYPGLFFSALGMDESYPGGESPRAFFLRIKEWFWEFCAACRGGEGNILIVTHGGVINVIYHLVKGIAWSNQNRAFQAANCSIHILNVEDMEFEVENRTDFLSARAEDFQVQES